MLDKDVVAFLGTIGIGKADIRTLEPLPGGVSNDVYAVSTATRTLVVKRALDKLRVAADWHADVRRLDTERRALELAHVIIPTGVPAILGYSSDFLALDRAPANWTDWKSRLMEQRADAGVAAVIGHLLASLQRATVAVEGFTDVTVFRQLRTDPFHAEVGRRFPALAPALQSLAEELTTSSLCLVHGDFSPKNVLVGTGEEPADPWIIDWEVTHRGDPNFDPAFLLCHLLLKSLFHNDTALEYEQCAIAFLSEYHSNGGLADDIPSILRHTGALILARVHGKSPVDYLDKTGQLRASEIGRSSLLDPPDSVPALWRLLS
ncbi:MAG TPA: phosphotransferase [Nocardioidaceae bacterium]|nr:phosphotransferase [Nocardioidaceae bacterium]